MLVLSNFKTWGQLESAIASPGLLKRAPLLVRSGEEKQVAPDCSKARRLSYVTSSMGGGAGNAASHLRRRRIPKISDLTRELHSRRRLPSVRTTDTLLCEDNRQ